MRDKQIQGGRRVLAAAVMVACALGLGACGGKDKKPSQSLARVNGDDVTVLQLNEEMQRAGVQAAQQEAASKRLLEALIDRQLLQGAAVKDGVDRDPKVVQAIERAKSLIIAQAYMQKKLGEPVRPTKAAVEEYFNGHASLFAQRKQFDMRQLVFATKDLDDSLKAEIDGAKTLDEVATWMDGRKVRYARAQLARNSAELPPELSAKLLTMPKGQLFIVKEGERSLLIAIAEIRDVPVTLEAATPQIEQFLVNQKNKEAADAEVARLRATAKIEYTNQAPPAADSNQRGVAGLK